MTTFVLVHGAWHGGWSWQLVSRQLEAAGHRAIAPTLTGLGERAHLISREVNLATHAEYVAAMLRYEDLQDVVLVGHNYAGLVITGAGAQEYDRVAQLIYYDEFLPDDGQSALDLLPPHIAQHFTESAAQDGGGWLMPRRPLEALGVRSPTAKAWLEPRLVPHPLATYSDKLHFDPRVRQLPSSYISCTDWAAVFAPYAEKAGQLGWPVREITAGHEALATAPHLLASAILELAGHSAAQADPAVQAHPGVQGHPAVSPTGQLAAASRGCRPDRDVRPHHHPHRGPDLLGPPPERCLPGTRPGRAARCRARQSLGVAVDEKFIQAHALADGPAWH